MRRKNAFLLLLAMAIILIGGCAKNYVITVPLEEPLKPGASFSVGEIVDELPIDMDEGDKPTIEDINKLKNYLMEELEKQDTWEMVSAGQNRPYEVTGSLLNFKRGSGALRFLFGIFAGSAHITVSLELVDLEASQVVYAGNFKAQVTDWTESGAKMYQRVAKDFAKELKKQLKKQLGGRG
jgi:hypothetical protein